MIKFVVFICGAIVMSFEILGSRVLAPNFGSSIFVWGSLISVFLTGLSAGYYLGGKFADINPTSRKLSLIVMAPGLLFLAFPLYSAPVSDWIFMKDLGVRMSPLLTSAVLFLIPAVFLGIVSPYTAKLMICSHQTSGKTIGTLYALSTFGSIIGTLITSFYLITLARVSALIIGQGLLLVALAVPLYFMNVSCRIEGAEAASSGKVPGGE
jgi:MFS family permease